MLPAGIVRIVEEKNKEETYSLEDKIREMVCVLQRIFKSDKVSESDYWHIIKNKEILAFALGINGDILEKQFSISPSVPESIAKNVCFFLHILRLDDMHKHHSSKFIVSTMLDFDITNVGNIADVIVALAAQHSIVAEAYAKTLQYFAVEQHLNYKSLVNHIYLYVSSEYFNPLNLGHQWITKGMLCLLRSNLDLDKASPKKLIKIINIALSLNGNPLGFFNSSNNLTFKSPDILKDDDYMKLAFLLLREFATVSDNPKVLKYYLNACQLANSLRNEMEAVDSSIQARSEIDTTNIPRSVTINK